MDDDLTPKQQLRREVFARFGLAYYHSECLHKEICNLFAITTFKDKSQVTRPRLEEKIVYAYSLTLGQILAELDKLSIIPHDIFIELKDVLEKRNYLAHHFWYEQSHLFASENGMKIMCQELTHLKDIFRNLDIKLERQFQKTKEDFGLTEKLIQDHISKIISGIPTDQFHQQRFLKKQERIIKIWNVCSLSGDIALIFESDDNSLWELCDVGLGWSYFKDPLPNWEVNHNIQEYLPANINPRPKIAEPFNYEFEFKNNIELWVRPGLIPGTLKWGLRKINKKRI